MTVAVKVNTNPCQAETFCRDFSAGHRMNKPYSEPCHEVAETRIGKLPAQRLARRENSREQASPLHPLRPAAQRRRAQGLLELDELLLLRVHRQLHQESQAAQKESRQMRYRIRNHTDLDTREVRRLISFAGADLDFDRGVVWVDVRWTRPPHDRTNRVPATGYAEWPTAIVLRIDRPDFYPLPWTDLSYTGLEIGWIDDWRESLVAIAAHELKHIAEYQRGCVSRGRLMEGRCDAYAFSRLSAYREKVPA